jgi:formylglycine-generating enzyme
MKLRSLVVGLAAATLMVGSEAKAQTPQWVWFQHPYAYFLSEGQWGYLDPTSSQWCYEFTSGKWTRLMQDSQLSGWSWVTYPYAYQLSTNGWYYLNTPDTQWVFYFSSERWRKLGTVPAPESMALIPAGEVTIGDVYAESGTNELPTHTVNLTSFYMDRTEVTKTLWDEVNAWATNHEYSFNSSVDAKDTNHPVHSITWFSAVKWCNARSEMEERTPVYYTDADMTNVYTTGEVAPFVKWTANGYRLPTEAEWEKAARGGSAGHRFPWIDVETISHEQANYFSTNQYTYEIGTSDGHHPTYAVGPIPYTSPAGSFAPNGFGLYDMSGNVWEWCWDWKDDGYYSVSPTADPRGPDSGTDRVVRGGSWDFEADGSRVARRESAVPGYSVEVIGFRTVMTGLQ